MGYYCCYECRTQNNLRVMDSNGRTYYLCIECKIKKEINNGL